MLTFGTSCMDTSSTGFVRLSNESFYMQNATYSAGPNRLVFLDTRNGEFSVNVVENPESGDIIFFIDIGGNLKLEPVRLFKLGKVFGQDVPLTPPATEPYLLLNKRFAAYRFIYVNQEFGWIYDNEFLNTANSDDPVSEDYITDLVSNTLTNYNFASNSNLTSLLNSTFASNIASYNFASNSNLTSLISASINNYDFTSKITQTINNITNLNADKLKTARTISLIGPVIGSVSFDGSQNVSIGTSLQYNYIRTINNQAPDVNGNLTFTVSGGGTIQAGDGIDLTGEIVSLTNTGITPGIYSGVQVDIKGRVIAGIPSLI